MRKFNEIANECGFRDFDALMDYLARFDGDVDSIINAKLKELVIRLIEKNYLPFDEHITGKQNDADRPF